MNALLRLYATVTARLEARASCALPTLARFVFAAVLLVYYLNSAMLKLGDGILGIFQPASGAYFQIFPRAVEAAGYDPSALGPFAFLVVLAGTWAEFALPVLIVLGLFTRLAALGMIGFVTLQTLTDIYGHRLIEDPASMGAWFDGLPDGTIMDQRLLWMMPLVVLVFLGAGPLSLDRLLRRGQRG